MERALEISTCEGGGEDDRPGEHGEAGDAVSNPLNDHDPLFTLICLRGCQELIVRTKCPESIHQQEGVDIHGKAGVIRPPGDPSLHIGHLHLCHWLGLPWVWSSTLRSDTQK